MNYKYVLLSCAVMSAHSMQSADNPPMATATTSTATAAINLGVASASALKIAGGAIAGDSAKSAAIVQTVTALNRHTTALTNQVQQHGDALDKLQAKIAKLKKGKARVARVEDLEKVVGIGEYFGLEDIINGYTSKKDDKHVPGLANIVGDDKNGLVADVAKLRADLNGFTGVNKATLDAEYVSKNLLKSEFSNRFTAQALVKLLIDSPNHLQALNTGLMTVTQSRLRSTKQLDGTASKDNSSDDSSPNNNGGGKSGKRRKSKSATSTPTSTTSTSTTISTSAAASAANNNDDKKQG